MVPEMNSEPRVIELRAFMGLMKVFAERNWKMPHYFALAHETTGPELLTMLDIPEDQVEAIFVNRKPLPMAKAVIRPGDRVALVPPGVPGPYRVLLGFKEITKEH
jgi:sulfur carrier protein ThiS